MCWDTCYPIPISLSHSSDGYIPTVGWKYFLVHRAWSSDVSVAKINLVTIILVGIDKA